MSSELGRGRIAGCACGGLWLNKNACRALAELSLSKDELAFVAAADERALEVASKSYRDASPVRSCPKCGKRLGRSRVKHTIDTVDLCRAHGAFFDPQEAARLDEALRALKSDTQDPKAASLLGRLRALFS